MKKYCAWKAVCVCAVIGVIIGVIIGEILYSHNFGYGTMSLL